MSPEVEGMFSAMLLVISILALSQFALYYWRSIVSGIAAQPVSGRVLEAAHVTGGSVTAQDFETFAGLHDLTPDLQPNARSLTPVPRNVRGVEGLESPFGSAIPAVAGWAQRERSVCR